VLHTDGRSDETAHGPLSDVASLSAAELEARLRARGLHYHASLLAAVVMDGAEALQLREEDVAELEEADAAPLSGTGSQPPAEDRARDRLRLMRALGRGPRVSGLGERGTGLGLGFDSEFDAPRSESERIEAPKSAEEEALLRRIASSPRHLVPRLRADLGKQRASAAARTERLTRRAVKVAARRAAAAHPAPAPSAARPAKEGGIETAAADDEGSEEDEWQESAAVFLQSRWRGYRGRGRRKK
jgi:hypothetical protein